MVDLAKEAFSTNNFGLAVDIYERTIRENGPTSELFLGLADSFARGGQFPKAFNAYTNAYRYGKVTPENLKHLVLGLIETVKTDLFNSGTHEDKLKSCMFTCGICRGLLSDPVTIPCGHTFCRKCIEKDKSKTCEICNSINYRLKLRNLSSNFVLTKFIEILFPSGRRVADLKKEGNECVGKGDYKKAIEAYSIAIEIAPDDHLLLSNRCHAFASLDLFKDALKDANKVLELRPDWPKGYFRKGSALYGLGKYEDAAVAFLQCLSLDQKVSSAKEYLSKTLDKILSVLPPDDPKAFARAQQCNPSLLKQLIDKNFSQPLLLPDIANTLSDLAQIVKDTICVANEFSGELKPKLNDDDQVNLAGPSVDKNTENLGACAEVGAANIEQVEGLFSKKLRCNSLPDVSKVDHDEIQKKTMPRTHSPVPSPLCRKRLRIPSSTAVCPVSPTHSSPHKALKSSNNTAAKFTSEDKEQSHTKPEALSVDDLECGLCYRLFFEPVTTPCGHTFCRKCLDRCLDHTTVCPMCKGNLAEYLAERRQTVTDAIQCIINTYFKKEAEERSKLNDEEMVELAKMGSGEQSDIPIFVCIMAFPTISCPLHIFEPRYRLMVRQCMESGTRQFGMCMQDPDDEFSTYGCMLEIRDVQYFPDGRSVVDTIGGRRFKVLSKGHRDGYSTAKVEFITDTPINPDDLQAVLEMQNEVYSLVQEWIAKLPTQNRTQINRHFGEQPAVEANPASIGNGPGWAWWAMNVLPLDPKVQMTLLAMTSYKDRLVALKRVLVYMKRRSRQ